MIPLPEQLGSNNRADSVTVLQGQDFLALDPEDEQFEKVTGLLLDPSELRDVVTADDSATRTTGIQQQPGNFLKLFVFRENLFYGCIYHAFQNAAENG
jgi:hypothetical protein